MVDDWAARRARHRSVAARALLRCSGACAISHESGAIALGLRTLVVPERVSLTRPAGSPRTGRTQVFVAALPASDVTQVDGVPVTNAERTVIDIARRAGFLAGIAAAQRVVECADPRPESAFESVVRARFIECGLPVPEHQVEITDGVAFLGRVDLALCAYGLACETDGRLKYADADALWREKLRQERLEAAGWIVLRWVWRDAFVSDETFRTRVCSALSRADPARIELLRRERIDAFLAAHDRTVRPA